MKVIISLQTLFIYVCILFQSNLYSIKPRWCHLGYTTLILYVRGIRLKTTKRMALKIISNIKNLNEPKSWMRIKLNKMRFRKNWDAYLF